MNQKIQIEIVDIALQKADAIVCLPNSTLSPIGAVASRIHKVAGEKVALECQDLIAKFGAVPVGSIAVTSAGNLDAKYIFHAIGPNWYGGEAEAKLLASCYHECISMAEDMELESIAFPSIATGSGGFPVDKAAEIFSNTINAALLNLSYLKQIKMVCADKETFESYSLALS